MGKTEKSAASKYRQWISEFTGEFTTDGKVIYCQLCCKEIPASKKFQIQQHVQTDLHRRKKNSRTEESSAGRQQLLTECTGKRSEFVQDLSNAMLAADIPWAKLDNPVLKQFLEKYCKNPVPSESTVRKNYLGPAYEKVIQEIRNDIGQSNVWISVDEATDCLGRYIGNVIVGKLDKSGNHGAHLLCSRVLEKTNHATIAQLVNESLNLLWPCGIQYNNVLLLVTDAASYMVKAAEGLKIVYPNLVFVTCLAHALHRICETVRTQYPSVNTLINTTKKMFLKAPSRVAKYKEVLPDLPLPPEPILTRWGTWLEAAEFYAKNFNRLKDLIISFHSEDADCIKKAQSALRNPNIRTDLACISANFTFLAESIKKLEEKGLTIIESLAIVTDAKGRLEKTSGDAARKVQEKLNYVLDKNEGFKELSAVAHCFAGCVTNDDNLYLHEKNPDTIASYLYAPITSCDVERSFSMRKSVLSDRRQKLTVENLEKILVVHAFHNTD